MAKCVTIQRKKRKVCIGARNRLITIQTRSIQPACSGEVDFSEKFVKQIQVKALVESKTGETLFDDVGIETPVTHTFDIRFIPGVTFEKWVLFNGIKYRILDTQNVDEENRSIIIKATKRGKESLQANLS